MTTGYTREQLDAMEDLFEKSLPVVPSEHDLESLPMADAVSVAGSPYGIWVRFHLDADQYVLLFLNPVVTLVLFQGINDCAMDGGWWNEQIRYAGTDMPTPTAESSNQANEVASLTTESAGNLALVHFARRDGSTQLLGLGKQTAIDLFLVIKQAGDRFALWDNEFLLLPAENSQRITDLEIWRAADQYIRQFGPAAEREATSRSRAAYSIGDMFNFEMWERVANALASLTLSKPNNPTGIN